MENLIHYSRGLLEDTDQQKIEQSTLGGLRMHCICAKGERVCSDCICRQGEAGGVHISSEAFTFPTWLPDFCCFPGFWAIFCLPWLILLRLLWGFPWVLLCSSRLLLGPFASSLDLCFLFLIGSAICAANESSGERYHNRMVGKFAMYIEKVCQ